MTSADTPYGRAALTYLERGWWPLPLPPNAKAPVPAGWTGSRAARAPQRADVAGWITRGRFDDHQVGNICVRMPNDVIGIDVDVYGDKRGDLALDELERRTGTQLPGTYSSTARGWGESRIRFYRVPAGTRLRANPGDGIEIVQHHHRYAVVWPSVHPKTRTTYRWYDAAGDELDEPPLIEDLTELPWPWIAELQSVGSRDPNDVAATPEDVVRFRAEACGMAKPKGIDGWRRKLDESAGSRHDRLVAFACWGAREALLGWYPFAQVEALLRAWWANVMDDPARRDGTEFDDVMAWAVAQAILGKNSPQMVEKRRQADEARARTPRTPETSSTDEATSDEVAVMPTTWSDAHVGEAFGATLLGRWLYCRARGGWLRWDGRRWVVDPGEAVYEEFRQWVLDLGTTVWKREGNSDTMKALSRYRDRGKIDSAVTIARRLDGIAAGAEEFDRHPHLLNVLNGVVDLRTGELGEHDPTMRMTRLAGADFEPGATHVDFDAVLEALNPDPRAWVQRLFGAAAFGAVVDDVLAVFDGTGSNGKTTLLKAVSISLGDYAAPASTRLLMARGVNDEHPTLIADLAGRRLVYIEETPEGGALKMEQVKAITGGGTLKARFIGRDYFEFEPSHQIVVATNHRPAVNASDYAAWRRLRLVPFTRTYVLPHEAKPGDLVADRGLRSRLAHPAQRRAALAWVVAGAVAWHAEGGLGGCAEIDEATSAWRRDEDVIHAWWADRVSPGGAARASDVYNSFVDWCQREGRRFVPSNKEFAKRFVDHDLARTHGVERQVRRNGTWYSGLTVVDVVGNPPVSHTPARGEAPEHPPHPPRPGTTPLLGTDDEDVF